MTSDYQKPHVLQNRALPFSSLTGLVLFWFSGFFLTKMASVKQKLVPSRKVGV